MRLRHSRVQGPFHQLREEMDRLLGGYAAPAVGASFGSRGFPPLNVWEEAEALFVEAELPGVKIEDLEITAVGNELTLSGKRGETPQADATYHRRERGTGPFSRVVRLPVEVDAAKVSAALHTGVLLITLPKAEAAKPRKVQVKVG